MRVFLFKLLYKQNISVKTAILANETEAAIYFGTGTAMIGSDFYANQQFRKENI